MARNDNRVLLSKRMEDEFSSWFEQKHITEQELYRFLHTMKDTSSSIGMADMAEFCASQLETLSDSSETIIPVRSLKKFIYLMRNFFPKDIEAKTIEKDAALAIEEGSSFILIIDDDVEFASFIKETLEENGVQVVIALNGKRGLELFYTLQPNMVIVDINLPDMNGFDILAQISDLARTRYVPIAFVSLDSSKENQIRAFEMGAMDFIAKPIDAAIFIPYILNRLQHKKTIWQSASTDELTGAGNRRQFNDAFSQLSSVSERTRRTFTLVILDLDYFKKVNDRYGHPVGDEVLRSFSQLVINTKRDTDYFFRYGGEEFALLLPDTPPDRAVILIEHIRQKLSKIMFTFPSFEPFYVTFSAGVSEFFVNQETTLSEADQALYQAKRNGRNQTVIYQPDSGNVKRHLNVVIIDDDVLTRKMLSDQFSSWKPNEMDIFVREYPDGMTFLESDWYEPNENYMILLDGIMPKMDGIEVLMHLRKRYPDDNIVVSMLTARTNESDIIWALKSGADDYIVKPFHPQEVFARVQRLTKRLFK
ncbi:GGDEF domain-containing response regulator [Domibacillus epiphyticus]|uniref:Diguanylate cyclase n=1 Tax=Domibacillus epiphyticus TaxID=1714355 RepID=A0A1V2AB27_9BACI|nr:diguanylate cyclase [Domibacillus epiphyticus]OMP68203.1 diguanylate cyclase [Domibacillus epiphyticus]